MSSESLSNPLEADRIEQELAAAYEANSAMNLALAEEFIFIDAESLP